MIYGPTGPYNHLLGYMIKAITIILFITLASNVYASSSDPFATILFFIYCGPGVIAVVFLLISIFAKLINKNIKPWVIGTIIFIAIQIWWLSFVTSNSPTIIGALIISIGLFGSWVYLSQDDK